MENQSKIILDLCGGTGAWSKPYKDAGFNVLLITLPEYDVEKIHHCSDFMEIDNQVDQTEVLKIYYKDVYRILAAPPCTMFSLARRTAKLPPDFESAFRTVHHCLQTIWQCKLKGNLKFWALENPMGLLRQWFGKPAMWMQPYWYGDPSTKRTDLWGYFNPPKKVKGGIRKEDLGRWQDRNWQRPPVPADYKHLKLDRSAVRAITPKRFAQAFYEANQ